MDHNAIHGPGISNFPPATSHRMPTVSAAQAFEHLTCSPNRYISTGIHTLDALLLNKDLSVEDLIHGGISRGHVTDIYGPPGVGKTSLAMQLTASVLHSGNRAIWIVYLANQPVHAYDYIDTTHKIPGPRLTQILTSFKPLLVSGQKATATVAAVTSPSSFSSSTSLPILLSKFTHFTTPSLAHLIALLSYLSQNKISPDTSLLVIDALSTLTTVAFLRPPNVSSKSLKPGTSNPASTRYATLQRLISTLQKLAATQNIAVVVTLQCVTKIRPRCGATLIPAIDSTIWEQGLRGRIVLFRDWGWQNENKEMLDGVRLAKVIKSEGNIVPRDKEKIISFKIDESGLFPLALSGNIFTPTSNLNDTCTQSLSPALKKRKNSMGILEIADSDDNEDYGWAEEYERDLPPPPPQWQRSENFLVGNRKEEVEKEAGERYRETHPKTEQRSEVVMVNENNSLEIEEISDSKKTIENSESDDEIP